MSRVMKRASGVEMVLLSKHFVVVNLSQWVVVAPGKSRRLPPTGPGAGDDPFVGNAAGLFEAGYAFSDLEVNPAVGTKCAEVLLVKNFVRDTSQREFHVLVAGHGGTVVKFLDV